jgi:hypothetical protein
MADESPLPTTLDDAILEILTLRSMLIREREIHVKLVERHELDKRSARGSIALLQKQNADLLSQLNYQTPAE